MIEVKGVSLKYPDGTIALRDINLQIKAGELAYVTGPSGSGKTSLLKLLMGVEQPTEGSLTVLGKSMEKVHNAEILQLRREIGPVFQDFRLIRGRTSLENIMLGMRFLDVPFGEIKQNALSALVKVGLEHKADSLVENLSWGESQRIAIARAVARKPSLILADEPTGNLDKDNALKILELLNSFRDKNTAVVITTHATHLIENERGVTHIEMQGGCVQLNRKVTA